MVLHRTLAITLTPGLSTFHWCQRHLRSAIVRPLLGYNCGLFSGTAQLIEHPSRVVVAPRGHCGSWSFHLSLAAATSYPQASALLTTLFALRTTGTSIILSSRVQAPRPWRSAFSSPITTLTAQEISSSLGAKARCAISTWLGWISCLPLKPSPLPPRHSSSSVR